MMLARSLVAALLSATTLAARAQAGGAPPAVPPTAVPPGATRVLTLDEALRTARERQPQLRQAQANVAAASARSDQAFAPLLPQVSASGSYQRTTANFTPRPGSTPTNLTSGSSSWNTVGFWNFNVTASELVYDFGQTSGRWRAAQAAASAQRNTAEVTLQQVLLTVRATYFSARANKDLVQVARDTLANQEAHLRQIEGFVRAGTRPEIDLAQARTDRANAQLQLINAENGYDTSRAQLNQAMGVDAPVDYDVGDETLPPVEGEEEPVGVLLEAALRDRPDVAALNEQVRAQDLTLGAIRGAYAPALGVSTALTDAGPSLDSTVWNWNATATLTWNLFQGGLTRAQEREARASLDAIRAQLEIARQQIRVDVEQARLAVRAAKGALGASGEAFVNAQQRLRLAEGRYQAGVGSVIELGDAQVALTTAAAQRVQSQYNLSSSRAQLLRALGRDGLAR
jgi:outer membrane protein